MPMITFTEAARIARVDVSTIKRAVKKGRLSAVHLDTGQTGIDPSELARAFPSDAPRRNNQRRTQDGDEGVLGIVQEQTGVGGAEVKVLSEQCEYLRKHLEQTRAMLEQAHTDIRSLTARLEDMGHRAILMLEDKAGGKRKKKHGKKGGKKG